MFVMYPVLLGFATLLPAFNCREDSTELTHSVLDCLPPLLDGVLRPAGRRVHVLDEVLVQPFEETPLALICSCNEIMLSGHIQPP
jgi:hypothetical protein